MQIDPFQLNQLENRQLLIAGRAPLLLIAAAVTTNNFEETEPTQETADGKQILLRRVSSNGHLKASATDSRTIKPGNHQIIGIGIAAQETDTELIKQVISAGNELPPLLSAVLPRRCLRCGTAAGIRLSEENCARCNLSVQIGKLFADRELSDAAWEHLRQLLGLPKALVKLTAAKARALSFLVTNFG